MALANSLIYDRLEYTAVSNRICSRAHLQMIVQLESGMKHRKSSNNRRLNYVSSEWALVLLIWCLLLCIVPDPRPLGASDWAVNTMRTTLGVSEPASRALATIALRACGLALAGVFLSLCLKQISLTTAALVVLLLAPCLSVLCQWINYGHFPIFIQLQLGITSAIVGALFGFAFRRSWIASGVLVVLLAGLYLWGTSTGISDDLAEDARATGEYLLANADAVPSGDEGFAKLLELAFLFAADNSHGTDAVHPNKAAILALGVILGEERVARVAKRPINLRLTDELSALRSRITLVGRNDLARHFWVSAALAILSNEKQSMTVGIGKELMDATEGGSGFSFDDLAADRAGTLLAIAATKNEANARNLQTRIGHGVVIADFFPGVEGLPSGLSRDEFQSEYGGLGGQVTLRLADEIEYRLAACQGLQTID
jgi:uncharacterized protein YfiM (DUF2279 family)/uncharacterized membrane protein